MTLTLLHSERPKLHGVLAVLSAIGLTLEMLMMSEVKILIKRHIIMEFAGRF